MNEYQEYILRAFLEIKLPYAVKESASLLLVADSTFEDICLAILRGDGNCAAPDISRLADDAEGKLLKLVACADDEDCDVIADYFRLFMLTASVIKQCRRKDCG